MNTMNVIEQLKEKSSELTIKIASLHESIDSLFAEHTSLTATVNEMLKQILKDSSSAESLDDTMNTLTQKSEKIMEKIHEYNALVRDYQYIRYHLDRAIEKLEEKPSSLCSILGFFALALLNLQRENELHDADYSASYFSRINNEIEVVKSYACDAILSFQIEEAREKARC